MIYTIENIFFTIYQKQFNWKKKKIKTFYAREEENGIFK